MIFVRRKHPFGCVRSLVIATFFLAAFGDCPLPAQTVVTVMGPDGQAIQMPAGAMVPGQTPTPGGPPADPSGAKDADGESKSKAKGDNQSSPEPKVIRRESTLDEKSDPDEFKARVGEDGKVAFEFRNQPWVELVQWLADISDQPLDWLELPADRVNLRSPGRYTVVETRDLFNRYLLARGYTLLEIDSGLTVAKTEGINPAIVPRIEPDDLRLLPMHSFARTSLDVGWLSAEKLAEELKPMISSNGRLTALTTTNRIEAMDAAVNLMQVAELLERERSTSSREALAPEFKLRYLPADEAKRMLEQFLGVEKKREPTMTPQQMQMMQQMRQNGGAPPPSEKKVEISIVANARQNSIIIRAPADRVAIATEFLNRVDVPSDKIVSLSDIQTRVQVFRLSALDPEKLIEIVSEMNVLEPTTRVRPDKDNNALIVSGSAADRFIISSLIDRLDGSGRSFEVMPLRRLDPTEVAESIAFLMGQEDKKEDQNNGRRSFFWGFSGDDDKNKEKDEFRVSANTRLRQIVLWANEWEMEEVRSLLVKLGELPPPGGNSQTVRIMDASATPETLEYLKRLRQQWSRLSPNPLELPDADQFVEPNIIPGTDDEQDADALPKPDADSTEPVETSLPRPSEGRLAIGRKPTRSGRLAMFQDTTAGTKIGDAEPAREDNANNPMHRSKDSPIRSSQDFDRMFGDASDQAVQPNASAPGENPAAIRIELDASGNLVLVSPDTDALDRLENLMLQMTPPRRPYRVFHINHASAYWMRLNLEDYFKDLEEDGPSEADRFYSMFWGNGPEDTDSGPTGLGKGVKLRFIDDVDTNTLVVSGATGSQLRTINELIELWDVPEPVNKRKARFTRLVKIQFGKADMITETVKEAYRDLLSSNDKTFVGGGGRSAAAGGQDKSVSKSRDGQGSELQDSESGRDGGGADFSFKGKLSLGIDPLGNTILVSAEGEPLLDLVTDMIDQLDKAAQPQGEVQVVELSGGINGERLKSALEALGGTSTGSNNAANESTRSRVRRSGAPATSDP